MQKIGRLPWKAVFGYAMAHKLKGAVATYTRPHKIKPEKIPEEMGKVVSRLCLLLRSYWQVITTGKLIILLGDVDW